MYSVQGGNADLNTVLSKDYLEKKDKLIFLHIPTGFGFPIVWNSAIDMNTKMFLKGLKITCPKCSELADGLSKNTDGVVEIISVNCEACGYRVKVSEEEIEKIKQWHERNRTIKERLGKGQNF